MRTTLRDYRPQRHNANKGKSIGLTQLDKSIKRDGYSAPMVAAADGEVFAGSKRLERSADVFGLDVEPIVVHSDGTRPVIHVRDDIETADDPRAIRLGVADNAIAHLDYDPDGELLAALAANDADLAEMVRADYLSARAAQLIADGEIDWSKEWQGMPEFAGDELKSFKSIVVHFKTKEDVDVFSELIDQSITEKTKSIWYPEQQRAQVVDVSQ